MLLEDACNKLDLQLAELGVGDGTGGATFSKYSDILNSRSQVATRLATQTSQATMLEQLATFMALNLSNPSQNQPLCAIRREASVARQLVDQMVITRFLYSIHLFHVLLQSAELSSLDKKIRNPMDGPFYHSLDESLNQETGLSRGTFIGNHVHKLLQVCTSMPIKDLDTYTFLNNSA